jgi:putative ABC transport system ATP-binding protein
MATAHIPQQDGDALPTPPELTSTWGVLRRGLAEAPELRRGLAFTAVLAITVTTADLVSPILVQVVFDHGFSGGFRGPFVGIVCLIAALVVVVAYIAGRAAGGRLAVASEAALAQLRVRTFAHIHRLSIAEQTKEKRGVLVSRVTADVDSLAQFTEWGAIDWMLSGFQIVAALIIMLLYSWQLTIPVVILVIPLLLVVGKLQAGFSVAYDTVRTRVGEMLSEVSESVMGAAVVRAYGIDERMHGRVTGAIRARYRAEMHAHRKASALFPISVIFEALAIASIIVLGAMYGEQWGLSVGRVTAFLFLSQLFLGPFSDLPEVYTETQTAISGWRKILSVLQLPVEIIEPDPGLAVPAGPLEVVVQDVRYRYAEGDEVLRGIDLHVRPGAHIAIVGETGSGKTTFAKLLARLADPTSGSVTIGGIDLREMAPDPRRRAIRMVPQDGFLFEGTLRENVRAGHEGATDRDVDTAFEELGLGAWVASLPEGVETPAGERGEALSVGERQLVALARAQIAAPGLLILDEATSAVDPGTELRISEALRRLSEGRTVVTIAHRLSTAEAADHVFVFDQGQLAQEGTHEQLVREGGVYGHLHESWIGNVREDS